MILKIEKLDHFGRGISKDGKNIYFVENALVGETVKVKVIKNKKNIFECKVDKILEKSPDRIESACPYYELCGGCQLLHIPYLKQLEFKENKVKEIIAKFSHLDTSLIKDIVPCDNQFFYRNKIVLKCDHKLGFYKEKSKDVVLIDKCLLADEQINEIINVLNKYKNIGEVTIRKSKNTDDLMVSFSKNIDSSLKSEIFKKVSCVYEANKALKNESIKEILNDKVFEISNKSFFQVNTSQAIKLYDLVKEGLSLKREDVVLDLYCGTGTIGIYLSDYVDKVIGIELVESSIKNAKKNALLNNCKNIDFVLGDVKNETKNLLVKPSKIVVDPPRAGLDKDTINYLNDSMANIIVYVSCDPVTLARDLELLNNYDVLSVTPLDMFPNTYHVETCTILCRKK